MTEIDLEDYFRNISICGLHYCGKTRVGNFFCKLHGGVGNLCSSVKKNGDRCDKYANDCGEKCGFHGGFSKKDIATLNRYMVPGASGSNVPLIVERYVQLLINRREIRERINIRLSYDNSFNDSIRESISESLISSFTKVSISDDCSICLSELSDGVRHPCCNQVSCGSCIKKWMCASDKCPYCRSVLT